MHTIAAVQMASGPNVSSNLDEAARHIRAAAKQGAKLIVLPEFFALMGRSDSAVLDICETDGVGPIQDFLSHQASEKRIWLVGGTVPMKSPVPGKARAACMLYNADGKRVARYDKIHLFNVVVEGDTKRRYAESRTIDAGSEIVVADTPFGRLGLAACYDLRFPELFRCMLRQGVEIIAVPSAFTAVTGKAHWETLVRARAVENLCYVIAAAQGGYHLNGRETHGDSMIVDPWGTVLKRRRKGTGAIAQICDRKRIDNIRRSFPSIHHMRLTCSAP